MYCKYCGEVITDDSLFCQYCGRTLKPINIISRNKSLNKKTKEELITIIMRKDYTERKHTKKIQELKQELAKYKNHNDVSTENMIMVKSKGGEYYLSGDKNSGYRIIDSQNKAPTIDTLFQDVFCHSREFVDSVLVKKDSKWGLINPISGEIICDYIYDDISQLEEDYNTGSGAIIVYSNGLCGKIDCEGKVIIPIKYDEILSNGKVKYKGHWGIVEDGIEIVPCEYSLEELEQKYYG